MATELGAALAASIAEHGPIGFDDYVAHALYAPGLGFYSGGGGAGRRRDFLTSPEVGPLFGAVIARALDRWWDDLGRPGRYPVVEAGAGPGTLARTILAAEPRCGDALELVLVESSEIQWSTHPAEVSTRHDLPEPGELGDAPTIVIANELLDNLPFGLVELRPDGWAEVLVDVDRSTGRLIETWVPLSDVRAAWCWGRAGRDADVGSRMPIQAEAAAWLDRALDVAAGGRLVAIDYASHSRTMARRPWQSWVRTYASHGTRGHPLEQPGSADITVEVAVDQLATVAPPTSQRTQTRFLLAHGIEDLVETGRARWHESGLAGGMEAIAGRSRVHEAEALLDPEGLGGFQVLEWDLAATSTGP